MLSCEICGEELMYEEDMKTHILLSHIESETVCPFCSLSSVSYDELNLHINIEHPESEGIRVEEAGFPMNQRQIVANASSKKHAMVEKSRVEFTITKSSKDRCDTSGGRVSIATTNPYTFLNTPQQACENRTPVQLPSVAMPCRLGAAAGGAAPNTETTPSATVTKGSREVSPESFRRCEDVETGTKTSEHTKAKQKRFSSPLKEKEFRCPLCALVCSDCFILQEHVELHLQETSTSAGVKSYECPVCYLVCINSLSLQEHVELHLNPGAGCAGNSGTDHMLARRLQQEENQRRKEQDAKLEAEEFKKLQKQFGLDSSGGYRKHMERNLERAVSRGHMAPAEFHSKRAEMMEALATGVDDCKTRTQGLLGTLHEYYQRECRDCVHVWLCAETDHFCSSEGDKGWGCGYRNLQMLLSSLQRMEPFSTILPGTVPNIPQVQSIIEGAWREGLDPQGASHFNQKLQGTSAWIGATEIYAVLTSLKVSARIIDFHRPSGPGDTHPRLFEWVKEYFTQSASRGARLPPRVVQTNKPPLYLQHQGHSRSVVGLEEKKNGSLCLLLLDPGCSPASVRKLFVSDSAITAVRRMRKFSGNLKHKQYQVVAVEGVLSLEEKQTRILNSKTLHAEKIP